MRALGLMAGTHNHTHTLAHSGRLHGHRKSCFGQAHAKTCAQHPLSHWLPFTAAWNIAGGGQVVGHETLFNIPCTLAASPVRLLWPEITACPVRSLPPPNIVAVWTGCCLHFCLIKNKLNRDSKNNRLRELQFPDLELLCGTTRKGTLSTDNWLAV